MRKLVALFVLAVIILAAAAEFLLPAIATGTIRQKVVDRLATDDVEVKLSSDPNILLALGEMDSLSIVAHHATVGSAYVRELTLTGSDVRIDLPSLFTDKAFSVSRAGKLTLQGISGEDDLRRVIEKQVDRLENVQVTIQPDTIRATGNAKIFGRVADIELTGNVVDDGGALYFQMTSLNIKNALLGTAKLDDMFGNIRLLDAGKMPLGLEIQSVEQQDGVIVVTAERKPK